MTIGNSLLLFQFGVLLWSSFHFFALAQDKTNNILRSHHMYSFHHHGRCTNDTLLILCATKQMVYTHNGQVIAQQEVFLLEDRACANNEFIPGYPSPTGLVYNCIFGGPHVSVQAYFCETWWFASLFTFILMGVEWLVLQSKIKFMVQQDRLLTLKEVERSHEFCKQNTLQKHLSASITHDIKAPLTYVSLALQGIYSICKIENAKIAEEVNNLYEVTKRISRYCNNIAQFYKITLTGKAINFQQTNVYDIVNEQIEVFRPIALQRKTFIINEVPLHTSFHTHADILAIIFHNLLDNAVKHTKNGTIHISIEVSQQHTIYIKIQDNGIGINAKVLAYLNANETTDSIRDAQEPANGLGLILVKEWIRILHGEIHIDSTLNKGTTVMLSFSAKAM